MTMPDTQSETEKALDPKDHLRTCAKCGQTAVAFICSEKGCPENGGAAYDHPAPEPAAFEASADKAKGGDAWSKARRVFVKYAEQYRDCDSYAQADVIADIAPAEIAAAFTSPTPIGARVAGEDAKCPHCGIATQYNACGHPGDGCLADGTAQAFAEGEAHGKTQALAAPDPAAIRREALLEAAKVADEVAEKTRKIGRERRDGDKQAKTTIRECYECEAIAAEDVAKALRTLAGEPSP